jgi:predicted nucleic acid-binding protein
MVERRYWDSGCFIAIVGEEEGRVEVCDPILRAAQMHAIEIVTSAFTITEVLFPKGRVRMTPDSRAKIKGFFRRSGLLLVEVDRRLAEDAQEYFWDHGVKPKDAIHVASAVAGLCPVLETYDNGLLKLDGKLALPGGKVLNIREPIPVGALSAPTPDLFSL